MLRNHQLFVGRLSARDIRSACRAFCVGSRETPNHESRCAIILARMRSEFSPMPAVKTKASTPGNAAASMPA